MASQNNHKTSNFWFGFSLGILGTGALVYFFGTKKGRETLQKLLSLTENFEETINMLSEELTGNAIFDEKKDSKKTFSSLGSLLSKIKVMSPR